MFRSFDYASALEFIKSTMEIDFPMVASLLNMSPQHLNIASNLEGPDYRKQRVRKLYSAVIKFEQYLEGKCIINELNHTKNDTDQSLLGKIVDDTISLDYFEYFLAQWGSDLDKYIGRTILNAEYDLDDNLILTFTDGTSMRVFYSCMGGVGVSDPTEIKKADAE
jgi:hypothetical protein